MVYQRDNLFFEKFLAKETYHSWIVCVPIVNSGSVELDSGENSQSSLTFGNVNKKVVVFQRRSR